MKLSIVVPCYNEEEILPDTSAQLEALLEDLIAKGKIDAASRIVFVDDGSRDRTWTLIEGLSRQRPHTAGIKLSRNRGHQNALLAGLLTVDGDAVLSTDADLQDDIGVVEKMIDLHAGGHDIVYGVRSARPHDSWFKRVTAGLFYRLLKWAQPDMIDDHADFRLMSRRAIEGLRRFGETNLYVRGLVTLIGFPSTTVTYERKARRAGRTKYPFRKMLAFAFDGLSSFSALPLRAITAVGVLTFLGCVGITAWALFVRLFTDRAIPGWASTVLPLYTLGAIQILCIGMLGEYLSKIYGEVKARPRFIIERSTQSFGHGRDSDIRTSRDRDGGIAAD
jgi:glycosyltransferase involved in cell wall biosynthesis